MKHVPDLKGFAKFGPYSPAVVANGFIFIAGQAPVKPGAAPGELAGTTIQEQTRQVLRNIEAILKELGSSLGDVVKTTVYLANPSDFKGMNDAYREFFPSDQPARSTARLGAEVPGILLSIDAIAIYSPKTEE